MRSDLLSHCPVVATREGQTIDVPPETSLLVVASGLVLSTLVLPHRRFVAFFVGDGDLLPPPVDGNALEALRPARVIVVDEETRRTLLADPDAADEVVNGLAAGLREREESLSHLAELVHRDRVLAKLVQLARKFGRVTPDGIRLDMPLTPAVADAPLVASRHVGKRISLSAIRLANRQMRRAPP